MRQQRFAGGLAGSLWGALLILASASGEPLPPGFTRGETFTVVAVKDGETASLADGRELRLAALLAPAPVPPRPGQNVRTDPELERLGSAARAALASLIAGQEIVAYFTGEGRSDRHGRIVAHVAGPGGEWVQAVLVAQGLARVQTAAETSLGAASLLRLEAAARARRLGLWRHEAFQVRTPRELGRWIETFQLVEGTAIAVDGARPAGRLAIEGGGGRLALNLTARARSELRGLGDLDGRLVRVRGWVRWQNGLVMDLTHGAALELPDPR